MANKASPYDDMRGAAQDLAEGTEAQIAELRRKVETLMADRVTPALADAAGRAEVMARDAADHVRDRADRLVEDVRERPLMSLGIAAAAGFMLAMLLRR